MKIMRVNLNNPSREVLDSCVEVLKLGGVFIYPSDTCYGIGSDFQNEEAIENIFAMKNRPKEKLFSVILDSIGSVEKIAKISEINRELLKKYLPGQFTFILPSLNSNATIGVRIPNFPLTQKIANTFGRPFITTSANIAGEPSLYSFDQLKNNFLSRLTADLVPGIVLNGGDLPENLPSTVVDLTSSQPRILRQGSSKFEERPN